MRSRFKTSTFTFYFSVFRNAIAAHHVAFHDEQSGIKYFMFGVGTEPCVDNIVSFTLIHLSTSISWTQNDLLPEGVPLFPCIVAYNNVDMTTCRCSSSCIVDETAPIFDEEPMFDMTHVGLEQDKQLDISQVDGWWLYGWLDG